LGGDGAAVERGLRAARLEEVEFRRDTADLGQNAEHGVHAGATIAWPILIRGVLERLGRV